MKRKPRKPRRTLWEQIRDKLLPIRGHSLDLLAQRMDDAAEEAGFNSRELWLACALWSWLEKTPDEQRAALQPYFRWTGKRLRAEDDAARAAEAANPTRPALRTVDIGGIEYTVRLSPCIIRDEDGGAVDAQLDHTRRILWIDDGSKHYHRGHLDQIIADAVTLGAAELAPQEPATVPPNDDPPRRVTPGEKLPAGELDALAADLQAVEWALLAPAGWPLPPGLPSRVHFHNHDGDVEKGLPPFIFSDDSPIVQFCPHCARPLKSCNGFRLHVMAKHGWTELPNGSIRPPAPPQEQRAA